MNTEIPATLVWTRDDAPHVLPGEASETEDERVRFRPAEGDRPRQGEKVILCLDGSDKAKFLAQVEELGEDGILIRPRGGPVPLRRYYPRVDTELALVYRVIELGPGGSAYSRNQQAVMKSWWRPASPEVNLSVNGLALHSTFEIPQGARLNIKLRLPNNPTADHSLTGDVVRCTPEQGPAGETWNRLAIEIHWMSPETHDAVMEYIGQWQEEALDSLEPAHPTTH